MSHQKRRLPRRPRLEILEKRLALATYHVDPHHAAASDSNDGSQGSPWATYLPVVWAYNQADPNIGRVTLQSDDTLLLHPALHNASFVQQDGDSSVTRGLHLQGLEGTAENHIRIVGMPGTVVDVRPGGGEETKSISIESSSYVDLEGLEISGYGRGVLLGAVQHVSIANCWFRDVGGIDNNNQSALEISLSSNVLVHGNLYVDSYDRINEDTNGQRTGNSRQIVLFSNPGFIEVFDNVLLNTPEIDADVTGAGIVEKHGGSGHVAIHDNVLMRMAMDGIGVSSSAVIHHNLLIDSNALHVGDYGGPNSHADIRFHHNTLVNRNPAGGHHDWEGMPGAFGVSTFDPEGDDDGAVGPIQFDHNIAYDTRSYNIDRNMVNVGVYSSDEFYDQYVPNLSIDHNGYFNPNVPLQFNLFAGGPATQGALHTFNSWQSQGFDAHSIAADPDFNAVFRASGRHVGYGRLWGSCKSPHAVRA